jgi:hypothetical protein
MLSRLDHITHLRYPSHILNIIILCSWLMLSACGLAQTSTPIHVIHSLENTASPIPAHTAEAMPTGTATPQVATDQPGITQSAIEAGSPTQTQPVLTPTQRTPPDSESWKDLPVIPTLSESARQVYQRGLEAGRNPHAFSKVGDCQSITTYFLARFDNPGYYQLGEQSYLQETIDWFAGSFKRESLAVKGGLNAAAMLSPLRADPNSCQTGESPLACELRINNPSIAMISLEEWWADDPTKYERYMRQIIEYTLSQDILPILATKADNLEGNYLINQTIAQLAWEYDLPLWNFWLAVQPLPNHGLMEKTPDGKPDMFHLTHSNNFYDYTDLQALQSGWAIRNLTALQTLDAVHRALNEQLMP